MAGAALQIRNSAARSIRSAFTATESEHFQLITTVDLNNRMDYLHSVFDRFNNNHIILMQIAAENQDNAAEQDHQEIYDRIESVFLDTRARLAQKLAELNESIPDEHALPQQQNDSETENDSELNEDNLSNIQSEHGEQEASSNTPQVNLDNQFGKLVERMCLGLANKKENTWGDYDGDLSKWQGFHDSFKSAVHDDELISPAHKLQLLKSSLKGRIASDFGEWPDGNNNYFEAWAWLKEQSEQPYATSKRILWKLMNFTKIEKPSGSAILKLCTITQGVVRQLKAMGFPVQYYDMIIVHCVHDKLDSETSKDWELQRASESPTVKDITDFLLARGRAWTNAQFMERKDSNDNRKRSFNGKEHKFEHKRNKPNTSNSVERKDSTNDNRCKICSERHYVHQCPKFKKLNLSERKNKVKTLNLCYNCLSPFHQVRDCKLKACGRCNNKHNHLLCHDNPINKIVNSAQIKKKANKQPKKDVSEQQQQQKQE